MIDIHSHVLPGVDDGATDEETSVAMCRLAARHGTTDLVATPHANHRFEFSLDRNRELRERLQHLVGPSPRLHLGCDFRLSTENIEALMRDPRQFAINQGPYLLVEFFDQVIAHGTSELFARMRGLGLTPILTHPERHPLLRDHPERLSEWAERGCLIQITGQSLLGRFGGRSRQSAISLVEAGLAHIVASDGHDLENRPPVLSDSFALVSDRWGPDVARRLFIEYPKAVIEGVPITPPPPHLERRKWWSFWK